jgi:DeoD family purine-nucleoside phosphorylase
VDFAVAPPRWLRIRAKDVPIHLHPTASLAERVLLPGDPGRALLLAQGLLDAPVMFNHQRGLWGYTGTGPDGEPLTVQSTGMGGPSAAIVVTELAELGARRFVRVGTCRALDGSLALGDLVIVTEAVPQDGTSRALGASGPMRPDPQLAEALRSAGAAWSAGALERVHAGRVLCCDLFYDAPEGEDLPGAAAALAVEMETATLFAVAKRRDLRAASVLLVSDLVVSSRARISEVALLAGERALGEVAAGGLIRA